MTNEDKIRLLKDIGILGKKDLPMRDSDIAAAKREEDKKHKYVYWLCPQCPPNHQTRTLISDGVIKCQCGVCSAYKQWSYRPFTEAVT